MPVLKVYDETGWKVVSGGDSGGSTGDMLQSVYDPDSDGVIAFAQLTGVAAALGTDDNYVTDAEKTKLSNLSGTNTGDQDLSGYSQASHNHSLNNLTEKSYNSLTDKPSIPSITGLLDETAHDALDHTGLTGIPAEYSLPTASTTVLGGVKVDGTSVTITDGVISSSGSGMTNPMTAAGDIIMGGTSGTPTRLAKGTDGQVLTLASGNPAWAAASGGSLLVAETVVTGSAVTSVTFSDLDGNAAGGYVLTIATKNSSGSGASLKLEINGDATESHYTEKQLYPVYSVSRNYIMYLNSGANGTAVLNMDTVDGTFRASNLVNDIDVAMCKFYVKTSVTNITSVAVSAAVASAIAVGSTFRLYKRK